MNGNKWGEKSGETWVDGEIYETLDVEIPVLAQPIVGDEKVYLGSFTDGKLYAINEETGDTAWSFQTDLGINHTAAYNNSKVYIGSLDGYFYSVNTADGTLAWKYPTGPIYSAPLIVNSKACIGSKSGYFYCFYLNDQNGDKVGDLIFQYTAEAPIYHSAAASPDGAKIYFGSEDMHPHCIKTETDNPEGEECENWTPQMLDGKDFIPGQSFFHYWPVTVQDKVIFTTLPIYGSSRSFRNIENLFDNTSETSWSIIEPMLINYYQNHPFDQTFFVLDAFSGSQAYPTAASHIAYHMDAMVPPALGPNDEAYAMYRSKDSSLRAESFDTKYPLEIGWMNIQNGHLSSFGPENTFQPYISHSLDDPSIFSSGGGIIYGVHNRRCVSTLDTTNQSEFMIMKSVRRFPTSTCIGDALYFFDDDYEPSSGSGNYPDIRGNNNRGEGLMPPSIAGNSMYVVFRGGAVLAITGKIR